MTGYLDFLDVIPTTLTTELKYYNATKNGSAYIRQGNALASAPTGAGHYLVECSLQTWMGTKRATASLGYTIGKGTIPSVAVKDIAAPVATEALDAAATTDTEHVTLNGSGAVTWDPAAPQDGNAAYSTAYKATVTVTPEEYYVFANNVTATVNGNAATVTKNDDGTLDISYTFEKTETNPNLMTQTISASDVTATYGDTGKKIEASTTGDGTLSYTVKSGDAVTVDGNTGALTIVKAGNAVITVSAAETDTYAQAEKDVTVTINMTNAVAATVTTNNSTYDGTEKPLVTVTGEATGGEMQYALGSATEATEPYTTSIPTRTEAGT